MRSGSPPEIPLSEPELSGNEWKYVKQALDDNWVSSAGPFVPRFEAAVAAVAGAAYGVATCNGTAAIHAALVALGVGPGDAVLVPALTFVGTINPVLYCGAVPVLIDVDPATWCMDPDAIAAYLAAGAQPGAAGCWRDRQSGARLRTILPVHLYGHPADMDRINALAAEIGADVVEDAAEALGARYRGRPVGALGRAGCFSFNGNKVVTTGGGGMVVTHDRVLAERVRYLTTQARDDEREYVHGGVGFNYRLTNLQAALGLAQVERLPEFLAVKRARARFYRDALAPLPGLVPQREQDWAESAHWLFSIWLDAERCGFGRAALIDRLAAAGIQSRPLFYPLHRQVPYAGFPVWGRDGPGAPVAEKLHAGGVNLPSSVGLREADARRVVSAIAGLFVESAAAPAAAAAQL